VEGSVEVFAQTPKLGESLIPAVQTEVTNERPSPFEGSAASVHRGETQAFAPGAPHKHAFVESGPVS